MTTVWLWDRVVPQTYNFCCSALLIIEVITSNMLKRFRVRSFPHANVHIFFFFTDLQIFKRVIPSQLCFSVILWWKRNGNLCNRHHIVLLKFPLVWMVIFESQSFRWRPTRPEIPHCQCYYLTNRSFK